MKCLTTLLALYLLGLSLWPCSDEALPPMRQEFGAAWMSSTTPKPGSSHEHHDACTPLCTCACCATTLIVIPQFSYVLATPVERVSITVDAFQYVPMQWVDPLYPIWQPPKVS